MTSLQTGIQLNENNTDVFVLDVDERLSKLNEFLSLFDTQEGSFNVEALCVGKPPVAITGILEDHNLLSMLNLNKQGYGIYFAVNQLNGKRNGQNVTSVRSLFLDLDGAPLEPVLDACKRAQIKPHAVVESSHNKYHVYFLVNDCELGNFKGLQRALAIKFDGDKAVCDLPRLMRLPYFHHQKPDKQTGRLSQPYLSNILYLSPEMPAYSVQTLIEGFELDLTSERTRSASFSFDDQQTYGEGERNPALCSLAGRLITRGLSDAEILTNVARWNQTKCNPPLEYEELENTVASIRKTHIRNHGAEIDVIESMNKLYAFVLVGGKASIIKETKSGIQVIGLSDFTHYFRNQKVNGQTLGKFWLDHSTRRTYPNAAFSPGIAVDEGTFNFWRGFPIAPTEGDCSLYLEHLKENICSGNEDCYKYLVGWMAHAIQNTAELPEVAIVMRSDQGTGKGVFARNFGKLFGSAFKHLTSREQLTGRFNSHQADSLCLFCDEITWGGRKEEAGVLKTLITEPTRMIEMKGKDAMQLKNFNRVIIATNEDWVVPTDRSDRRMFIIEPSNTRMKDTDYFGAIEAQMKNGGIEALMYFLQNLDISDFNVRTFPKTEHRLKQKLLSMNTFESWWFDALKEGCLTNIRDQITLRAIDFEPAIAVWPEIVGTANLYQLYSDYCQLQKDFHPLPPHVFGSNLIKIANITKSRHRVPDGKRVLCYYLPTIDVARQLMEKYLNEESIDWEE